jgi:hypothetical protein
VKSPVYVNGPNNAMPTDLVQDRGFGEFGYLGRNDCKAIIREVPADQPQRTLTEMELSLDTCTEQCPHCKSVNLIREILGNVRLHL